MLPEISSADAIIKSRLRTSNCTALWIRRTLLLHQFKISRYFHDHRVIREKQNQLHRSIGRKQKENKWKSALVRFYLRREFQEISSDFRISGISSVYGN